MGRAGAAEGAGSRLAAASAADRDAGERNQPDRRRPARARAGGCPRRLPGQGRSGGDGIVVAVRAFDHAASDRHALARTPVGAGLPASGHPSARLCAEEPQAGIQARSLRTVLGHAGPHPRRRRPRADDGARAVVGTGRAGRSRSRPAACAERANTITRTTTKPLAQSESDDGAQPVRNALPKVGRNDPCPCGSGKKYKQCHGKLV